MLVHLKHGKIKAMLEAGRRMSLFKMVFATNSMLVLMACCLSVVVMLVRLCLWDMLCACKEVCQGAPLPSSPLPSSPLLGLMSLEPPPCMMPPLRWYTFVPEHIAYNLMLQCVPDIVCGEP